MSTTTQAVRRKLSAEPQVADAKEATAPNAIAEEAHEDNGTDTPAYVEAAKPNDSNAISTFRRDVQENLELLSSLISSAWDLPLSRETVFALGELSGSYSTALKLLQRDISDAS